MSRGLERAQSTLLENSSIAEFGVKLDGSIDTATGTAGASKGEFDICRGVTCCVVCIFCFSNHMIAAT